MTSDCAASVQMEARKPPAALYSNTSTAPITMLMPGSHCSNTVVALLPAFSWAAAYNVNKAMVIAPAIRRSRWLSSSCQCASSPPKEWILGDLEALCSLRKVSNDTIKSPTIQPIISQMDDRPVA